MAMDQQTQRRIAKQRARLISVLTGLLKKETGVLTDESLAYYLQVILRKNALGKLHVPVHIVDWIIMVAYMPKPDIHILQLLIEVLNEPHDFKVNSSK